MGQQQCHGNKENWSTESVYQPKTIEWSTEEWKIPVTADRWLKLLPEFSKAKVFSTVNFWSQYLNCILNQESSLQMTFSTPHRRYHWHQLPFGLSISSKIFQKRVNQVLDHLDRILAITDDISIYFVRTTEEANEDHDCKLLNLLNTCKEYGVTLNPDKVKLKWKEVKYLGHVFSHKSLKMDPDKVAAVLEMLRPTDVKAIQRLNSFVNCLTKFLPKIADNMELIRKLTHKDLTWEWSQQHNLFEINRFSNTRASTVLLKDYLVTSDYYSNLFKINRFSNTRASTVILKLKNHFTHYGRPEWVISDNVNGPQFSSKEFAQFADQWDFFHIVWAIANPTGRLNEQWKQRRVFYIVQ